MQARAVSAVHDGASLQWVVAARDARVAGVPASSLLWGGADGAGGGGAGDRHKVEEVRVVMFF